MHILSFRGSPSHSDALHWNWHKIRLCSYHLKLLCSLKAFAPVNLTLLSDSAQLLRGTSVTPALGGWRAAKGSYEWEFQWRAQTHLRKFQWNSEFIYQSDSSFYCAIWKKNKSKVSLVFCLLSGHFRDINIQYNECSVDSQSSLTLVLAGIPSGHLHEIFLTACL